jgi:uncharacterized protein YndB with AHSA1/START domain
MSERDGDVTFECDLDEPPEKVWRAISEPALREEWLGAPETGTAEVVQTEPGSRLDIAWPMREGESLVSFEVSGTDGGGSRLTIVHRAPVSARVLAFKPRVRARTIGGSGWRMAA